MKQRCWLHLVCLCQAWHAKGHESASQMLIKLTRAAADGLMIRATELDQDPAMGALSATLAIPGKGQMRIHFAWPIHVDQHRYRLVAFC